eukprot:434613_1
MFNQHWCLKIAPVDEYIYLAVCSLPPKISNIFMKWGVHCDAFDDYKHETHDFDIESCRQSLSFGLSFDKFKKLDSLTFYVDLEVCDMHDTNDNKIDEDNWYKYALEEVTNSQEQKQSKYMNELSQLSAENKKLKDHIKKLEQVNEGLKENKSNYLKEDLNPKNEEIEQWQKEMNDKFAINNALLVEMVHNKQNTENQNAKIQELENELKKVLQLISEKNEKIETQKDEKIETPKDVEEYIAGQDTDSDGIVLDLEVTNKKIQKALFDSWNSMDPDDTGLAGTCVSIKQISNKNDDDEQLSYSLKFRGS